MSLAFEHSNGLNDRWRGAVEDHKVHATSEWPHEACGVIRQDGSYLACENVAQDTLGSFQLPRGLFEAENPLAILHSHTSGLDENGEVTEPQNAPSAFDMVHQVDTALPWGISLVVEGGASDPFWFGDEVERPPLYGRVFRHGVEDCYAFIRDWHREVPGITFQDFPRDPDWWTLPANSRGDRKDLYMEGFREAGFVETGRTVDSILPGDVFLCTVRSTVINHGGVYLGDGLIGHHLSHQLSKRDPASIWRPKLNFLVRHKDLPEDWHP